MLGENSRHNFLEEKVHKTLQEQVLHSGVMISCCAVYFAIFDEVYVKMFTQTDTCSVVQSVRQVGL